MIHGLDRFKQHFASFTHNYVLIGGTACSLILEEAGLSFRATKDFDIVLCIEALDRKFGEAFWDFIRLGRYKNSQKSSGKKLFYRFFDPEEPAYPSMLELFSRKPNSIPIPDNCHLSPIPVDEEISSLSAILLNDEYYAFIQQGKREINGVSILGPEYLIPMKAYAWLNLFAQRTTHSIDRSDLRKHKNDIVRLYQLLTPNSRIPLPNSIKVDLRRFLSELKNTPPDFKNLGIKTIKLDELLSNLSQVYDLKP